MTHPPTSTGKTCAHIQAERRGYVVLAAIVILTCTPAWLWMIPGISLDPGVSAAGVIMVWMWNFWFLGPTQLLIVGAILFHSPVGSVAKCQELEKFALGLALERGLSKPQNLSVKIDFLHGIHLSACFRDSGDKQIWLDQEDCNALLDLLTGDGNIYHLAVAAPTIIPLHWPEISAHEKKLR